MSLNSMLTKLSNEIKLLENSTLQHKSNNIRQKKREYNNLIKLKDNLFRAKFQNETELAKLYQQIIVYLGLIEDINSYLNVLKTQTTDKSLNKIRKTLTNQRNQFRKKIQVLKSVSTLFVLF